jgi:hypothetical protein
MRSETDHSGGVVICGDCFNPLYDRGYHLFGARDANGRRERACIDEPVGRTVTLTRTVEVQP